MRRVGLVLLAEAYKLCGMEPPWQFRLARDVRTLFAVAGVEAPKPTMKHHAMQDAISQAQGVIVGYRKLGIEIS